MKRNILSERISRIVRVKCIEEAQRPPANTIHVPRPLPTDEFPGHCVSVPVNSRCVGG